PGTRIQVVGRRALRGVDDEAMAAAIDRLHPLDPRAVTALADALRRSIDGEVRFDDGTRALYATDGSNYRLPPIGVVIPRHREDILTAVRLCREHDAPVLT